MLAHYNLAVTAAKEKHKNDKPRMPPWLFEFKNTFLARRVGAHFYDLESHQSDIDFVRIVLPPKDQVLASMTTEIIAFDERPKVFEKYMFHNLPNGLDLTVMTLPYFMRQLCKGTPNMLELVVPRQQHTAIQSRACNLLRLEDYLSKEAISRLCLTALTAIKNARKVNANPEAFETKRTPDKTLSHAARMLDQATSIMYHGDIELRQRQFISDIKFGLLDFDEAVVAINFGIQDVMKSLETFTDLPERVDKPLVRATLMLMLDEMYSEL